MERHSCDEQHRDGNDGDEDDPDAHGADRARLVEQVQGRVEGIERHEAETRQRERQDALDLPHPAPLLALGSAARARGSLGGSVGHQTSRTSGITTGLRSKRWLMKRRTALRTTAPISSRSITSGSSRAASASRMARLTSSISSSDSFTYTNPREAISGPATIEPVVLSTVSATTTIPASARSWRSRSTTCPTSPIPLPSTKTRPAG